MGARTHALQGYQVGCLRLLERGTRGRMADRAALRRRVRPSRACFVWRLHSLWPLGHETQREAAVRAWDVCDRMRRLAGDVDAPSLVVVVSHDSFIKLLLAALLGGAGARRGEDRASLQGAL